MENKHHIRFIIKFLGTFLKSIQKNKHRKKKKKKKNWVGEKEGKNTLSVCRVFWCHKQNQNTLKEKKKRQKKKINKKRGKKLINIKKWSIENFSEWLWELEIWIVCTKTLTNFSDLSISCKFSCFITYVDTHTPTQYTSDYIHTMILIIFPSLPP